LDPVAAFLLARGNLTDRPQAETEAQIYYAQLPDRLESNDALDPRRISSWIEVRLPANETRTSLPKSCMM
jgi:hypothetical protein